jgi:Tat protein translocase TatB subunit
VFNVGPEKLLLLLVIALVVLGPKRLPDAARSLGRAVGELRRLTGHIQEEVHDALADPRDALTSAVGDLRRELGELNTLGFGAQATNGGGPSPSAGAASAAAGSSASPSTAFPAPTGSPAPPPSPHSLPPSPDDPSLN